LREEQIRLEQLALEERNALKNAVKTINESKVQPMLLDSNSPTSKTNSRNTPNIVSLKNRNNNSKTNIQTTSYNANANKAIPIISKTYQNPGKNKLLSSINEQIIVMTIDN